MFAPGPCNERLSTETRSTPVASEIVLQVSVDRSTVLPLCALAIATRKLPLPASLQFVTGSVAAPASGQAKAAPGQQQSGRQRWVA